EQPDRVLELQRILRIDGQRTQACFSCVADHDIQPAVLLPRNIDVPVPDFRDGVRNDAGRRTCSVKQIAKRLIREELGVVASEHDLLRTYHVDLVLDLDIEVVNRDAKVGETGLPDDSGRKCLRGFRNQLTCAAAGHDRGRDSEEEVLWYPVGSTVVCYAL